MCILKYWPRNVDAHIEKKKIIVKERERVPSSGSFAYIMKSVRCWFSNVCARLFNLGSIPTHAFNESQTIEKWKKESEINTLISMNVYWQWFALLAMNFFFVSNLWNGMFSFHEWSFRNKWNNWLLLRIVSCCFAWDSQTKSKRNALEISSCFKF